MRIEHVTKDGEILGSFVLETNPFKVGETIHVAVSNHDNAYWDVSDVRGLFSIDKIEHYLRKDYTNNKRCITVFTTCVTVSPV